MTRHFRFLFVLVGILLVLALMAGCGPAAGDDGGNGAAQDPGTATTQDAATDAPAAEAVAQDVMSMNLAGDVSNLIPQQTAANTDFRAFTLMFSNLVRQVEDGFAPNAAERWETSPDGTSYTFWLRDDVLFHNGDLMTSRDVVFTFEEALVSPFVAAPLDAIASVTAIDDFIVRFDLHDPFAPFLLSVSTIWILNEDVITEQGDDAGRHPIGTGPYKFVEHQPGRSLYLTRFDDYFGGPAIIRDVQLMVILSPATLSIAVEAGDIDLGTNVPPGDFLRLGATDGLQITYLETSSLNFLTLNTLLPPFDDIRVREAIARAVDREGLIAMVGDGFGNPAYSFLNSLTFGHDPNIRPFPRDVAGARELLAEAGFPDGFSTTLMTVGGGGIFESIAQVIQANLADIGITVTIELLDQAVAINNLLTHNYNMGILAIALPADADAWGTFFMTGGGLNMSGMSDPEVDAWFEEGRVLMDAAMRLEIYSNIQQRINDYVPVVPLYFPVSAYVHNAALQMPWIDSVGNFRFDQVYWSE
jgi:peptide/nickel transport system substrate-binding protein